MESDAERFERLSAVFAHARDLEPEARTEYLSVACGGDEELRIEVEELLAEDARRLLDAVDHALVGGAAQITPRFSARPELVGKYRIIGVCGSGGMGTVYEATQESPKRRVAVKVIQANALRPDLLSRFRREAEILGRLDHPGIAQIFEAGEFEQDGQIRPFFAMEFVDGTSLIEFATQRDLSIAASIDLLVDVCDAIQYAHDRGVVHRDLKPDNILVVDTSDSRAGPSATYGRPRILDFGVARLSDPDAEMTLHTSDGTLLGSVAYMSPEQASGGRDDVDGRSDLYSLGVIAFELLSGALPYAVRGRPLAEALDAIRQQDPTHLQAVDPSLAQDLGTIIDKCLQKDRSRRYERVAELAEDLRSFRQLKPIKARPPSSWYQLQRFTQRNRALVGGVVASTFALTIGAIAALLFALQSIENARTAEANQADAERATYRTNILAASSLIDAAPQHARRILADVPEEARGWEHRYLSAAVSPSLLEFGKVVAAPAGFRMHRRANEMHLLSERRHVLARNADDAFEVREIRTGRVLRSFTAPEEVRQFTVSADGSTLAAVLASGRVVVKDLASEDPNWQLWYESTEEVDTLALSRDGERLALENAGGVHIGRLGEWRTFAPPIGRAAHISTALEFDPDGEVLYVLRGNIYRVDVRTGESRGDPLTSTQVHWCIAVSPSGRWLAAGQQTREVRIHDLTTGELVHELFGHVSTVVDVAFSGEDRVVSVDGLGGVRVWDLRAGAGAALVDAPGTVQARLVGDDELLTSTEDRLRLWTLSSPRARVLVGHAGRVFVPVFSGDGTLLATSAPWEDTLIWDPLETAPLQRFPSQYLEQIAFDRTGDVLLESNLGWMNGGWRRPWPTGQKLDDHSGHNSASLVLRRDGQLLVDGGAAPFEPGTRGVFRVVHHVRAPASAPAAFMDGARIPLASERSAAPRDFGAHPKLTLGAPTGLNGDVSEWIAFEGELSDASIAAVETYLNARKDGATVAFPTLERGVAPMLHFRAAPGSLDLSPEGYVRRWNAQDDSGRALRFVGSHNNAITFVPADSYGPDRVAFEYGWGTHAWMEMEFPDLVDVDTVTVFSLGTIVGSGYQSTAYAMGRLDVPFASLDRSPRMGKASQMTSFGADGRLVATCFNGTIRRGAVRIRDMETAAILATIEGEYTCVDFHPNSRLLACGHVEGHVDLFDAWTRTRVARFVAHQVTCHDVAFSPDGSRLATAGGDNALRLWETERYEEVLEFPGHRSYVRGVAWSPDGTMLVSACGDMVVRVWDSVPEEKRYQQRLANRALEHEVESAVESFFEDGLEVAAERIGEKWSNDLHRRRAAQKVLARLDRAQDPEEPR